MVLWMIADILFFAAIYFFCSFHESFSAAIIHSMYVFTTVGYDSTINSSLQYAVAIEAMTGVLLVGLFLSALVNKVRY